MLSHTESSTQSSIPAIFLSQGLVGWPWVALNVNTARLLLLLLDLQVCDTFPDFVFVLLKQVLTL